MLSLLLNHFRSGVLNPFIINSHGFPVLFPRNMNFEAEQCVHWAEVKALYVTSCFMLIGYSPRSWSLPLSTGRPTYSPNDPISLPLFSFEGEHKPDEMLVPRARDVPPFTVRHWRLHRWRGVISLKSLILFLMISSLFPWKPSWQPHSCPHRIFLFSF